MSKAFCDLLEQMREIHEKKEHDYAGGVPFANFKVCEAMGIKAWIGALVRMSDKMSRLMSFAKQGELKVKDESVEDTLLDMANYALLTLLLYREAKDADRERAALIRPKQIDAQMAEIDARMNETANSPCGFGLQAPSKPV